MVTCWHNSIVVMQVRQTRLRPDKGTPEQVQRLADKYATPITFKSSSGIDDDLLNDRERAAPTGRLPTWRTRHSGISSFLEQFGLEPQVGLALSVSTSLSIMSL